jgi:hypothetical protein
MFVATVAERGQAGVHVPSYTTQLGFSSHAGAGGLRAAIAAREFLHATRSIDELLFASEKRMTCRADADFNVPLGERVW